MTLRALALLMFAGVAGAATPPWMLPGQAAVAVDATVVLPPLDLDKARAEDYRGKPFGDPPRVGLVADVATPASIDAAGQWDRLDDGRAVWRLAIDAPNALGVDFAFGEFRLPAGAELWIRSRDGKRWLGPYTDADNPGDAAFYTPMLRGDGAVLELLLPAERREFARLTVTSVSRYYRDPLATAIHKSGSCNIDTICPTGDPYREEIASVAHYTFRDGGSTFVCSGQLAATTERGLDVLQPTFLTAFHCVSDAASAQSVVLYWRYQSPECREPGSTASGTPLNRSTHTAATQSGATLLAGHEPSDFVVLRLTAPVPVDAQAIPTGWDRSGATPLGSVIIHHPAGDEKRISINDDALTIMPSCIAEGTPQPNTHWRVDDWEFGTTEPGSSGAGLWTPQNPLLIGVLSGGVASCTVRDFDCFGRLSAAWEGGGTPSTRMRDWLDPAGLGVQQWEGGLAETLDVALASTAFTTLAAAGDVIVIEADVTGGIAPYTFEWDVDGDGVFDRRGSEPRIELSYAARTSSDIVVRVSDAAGVFGQATRALDVAGAEIAATAGAPVQVCGDGDAALDPGERWSLPVQLQNVGNAALGDGGVLFAPSAEELALPIGPNEFGYRAGTSADGNCDHDFIDIASGANAVQPLPVTDTDDGRVVEAIELGGDGVTLYGQRYVRAVMSTNGYVSFSASETGEDWSNTCDGPFDEGAAGPQLRPLHDDLVISPAVADAGLRYRWFDSCPRPAEAGGQALQGCHVFQWTGMERFDGGGSFEFQAIAYAGTGQFAYQYRTADPLAGGSATIGVIDAPAIDRLNVTCPDAPAFDAVAGSAVCVFAPQALPGSAGNVARLPQPVQHLPGLAAGASTTVQLPFVIPPDASCTSPVAIDYIASAAPAAHGFDPGTVLNSALAADCQPVSGCALDGPAPDVRPGLYYDPLRDGNGVNTVLVPQPDGRTRFGGLWYTGLPDRTPTWYELNGLLYELGGEVDLLSYRNAAAPGGFQPVGADAGRAWVGYSAGGQLLLAWDLGNGRQGAEWLQREPFPFADPNHTSAWFAPSEGGWGVAIESLALAGGDLEFSATYLYDAEGRPRWVTGTLPTANGGTFPLLAYSPQCPGCPRFTDVQQTAVDAGTLQIDYDGQGSAVLGADITLPPAWPGTWDRAVLPIQPIAPPPPPGR